MTRLLATYLTVAALTLGLTIPPAAAFEAGDPANYGPYMVGRTHHELHDPARDRTIPTDIWYPATVPAGTPLSTLDLVFTTMPEPDAYDRPPPAPGSFPLVVFSHGSGTISFQSYTLMARIASWGYIVVAPTHYGDSIYDTVFGTDQPPGRVITDRYLDIEYILDHHTDLAPAGPHIDMGRIATMGHSMGTVAAMSVADGNHSTFWQVNVEADPRIDAVITVGPATVYFMPPAPHPHPLMIIGGTADTITPPATASTPLYQQAGTRRFQVDITGASHGSFSDECDLRTALRNSPAPKILLDNIDVTANDACDHSTITTQQTNQITAAYTVAFLNTQLPDTPTEADQNRTWLSHNRANRFPITYTRN